MKKKENCYNLKVDLMRLIRPNKGRLKSTLRSSTQQKAVEWKSNLNLILKSQNSDSDIQYSLFMSDVL